MIFIIFSPDQGEAVEVELLNVEVDEWEIEVNRTCFKMSLGEGHLEQCGELFLVLQMGDLEIVQLLLNALHVRSVQLSLLKARGWVLSVSCQGYFALSSNHLSQVDQGALRDSCKVIFL